MNPIPVGQIDRIETADWFLASGTLPLRPSLTMVFVPFVLKITPCQSPGGLPVALTGTPRKGEGGKPLTPVRRLGRYYRQNFSFRSVKALDQSRRHGLSAGAQNKVVARRSDGRAYLGEAVKQLTNATHNVVSSSAGDQDSHPRQPVYYHPSHRHKRWYCRLSALFHPSHRIMV